MKCPRCSAKITSFKNKNNKNERSSCGCWRCGATVFRVKKVKGKGKGAKS